MSTVTIHQPEHLPRMSYFDKMRKADIYVFLDSVPYRKNYFQNRNLLGNKWVTIPVLNNGHITSELRHTKIDNSKKWQRKYWGRMADYYRSAPNFKVYEQRLSEIVHKPRELLVSLDYDLIDFMRRELGIMTPTFKAFDMNVTGSKSELLFNICSKLNADVYLSGPSGRNYLDTTLFDEYGIEIQYHDYKGPNPPALDVIMGVANAEQDTDM